MFIDYCCDKKQQNNTFLLKIPYFYLEKQYNVLYMNTHESNQAFIKKKGGEACENQENRVEIQFLLLSDQIDN